MEYKVIEEYGALELNMEVNRLLNIGWSLYGDLVVSEQGGKGYTEPIYAQAMVYNPIPEID